MFDTLDDKIKRDEAAPTKERIVKGLAVAVLSLLLFGGLYFAIKMMD